MLAFISEKIPGITLMSPGKQLPLIWTATAMQNNPHKFLS